MPSKFFFSAFVLKFRIFNLNSGGGSNCSVFCALSILMDQFKNDQYVDVCRTVKRLKLQRPRMIDTFVSIVIIFVINFKPFYIQGTI